MPDWMIYYGDGTVFCGEPESAPTRDVQVILQVDERVGWHFQSGADYYVWMGEKWLGVDHFGMYDYLLSDGWKRVLFGRTISNAEYQSIYQRAKSELARKKTSWLPGERR